MITEKKISKFEDAMAFWFHLGYSETDLYSLTTVDAYRTPTAQILTQEQLDKFLEEW